MVVLRHQAGDHRNERRRRSVDLVLGTAERAADDDGLAVIGVFHSHTHSEPYPSPTDVAQAVDPGWHYVIVTIMRGVAEPRSYLIADGGITEETIVPV